MKTNGIIFTPDPGARRRRGSPPGCAGSMHIRVHQYRRREWGRSPSMVSPSAQPRESMSWIDKLVFAAPNTMPLLAEGYISDIWLIIGPS